MEDKLEGDQPTANMDTHKSDGDQDITSSADNLSSESEAEGKKSDDDDNNTETTLVVPPKEAEREVSITFTTSDRPSNTFITDLKTTDPNMVRKLNFGSNVKGNIIKDLYCILLKINHI